jgi:hypothetical protein
VTRHRYTSHVGFPLIIICVLIFMLMLIQRLSSLSVWDDAYFFIRYADNLLQYGQLAWNPNSTPTYGLTSPAYLLLVIPLRIIFPTEPAFVMLMSSLLSGFIVLMLSCFLAFRILKDQTHRLILICIMMTSLIVAGEHIITHLTSGMDTMFAIACLTAWLLFLNTSQSALKVGIFAGLFFWIRPDILLIVGGVAFLQYSASHSHLTRFFADFSAYYYFNLSLI